jgi:hypothetical protein
MVMKMPRDLTPKKFGVRDKGEERRRVFEELKNKPLPRIAFL